MLFGRFTRIIFDIVGTLVVLVVVGAALLSWRLSVGPLSLQFMTPLIERALSGEDGSITVAVDDTILAWGGWQHTFDVRVHGLRALGRDGRLMLEMPEVSVNFSPRALLHGLIAPTSLAAFGAHLVLVRGADGTWHFRGGAPADDTADETPSALPFLLGELLARPDPGRSLGYLRSASLLNSAVTIVDEASRRTFVARDAHIAVRRDEGGLHAELSAVVDLANKPATLSATGHYDAATSTLNLGVDLARLDPTSLADLSPSLAPLAGFNVPLSGRITLSFDPAFRLAQAGFDVSGENGQLDAARYNLPENATVRRLRVRGRMPEGLTSVQIQDAQLDLGGPVVNFHGQVVDMDTQPRADGVVTAHDVPTDDLRRLWPHGLGENSRVWITENLSGGVVGEATAEFAAGAAGPSLPWTIDHVNGTMKVAGVEVSYLSPMPHIKGVNGDATFTKSRFDIIASGGTVGSLHLDRATIALMALDTHDETADLDVSIKGPLREALDLVDGPPLGYLKKIDLKPEDFAGDAAIRLALKFPLEKKLKVEQIEVLATADVQHLSQHQAALGQDAKDGQVKVRVDREGMDIAGHVTLGPIPADVELRRNFSDQAPIVGRSQARARLATSAERAAFGFDLAPYVDGPMVLALDYVEQRGGHSEVTLDTTLDESTLSVAQLDWQKPAGKPATAHAVVNLAGGRAVEISRFTVSAGMPAEGGLTAQGRVAFADDGRTITRVDLDSLKVGLTDVKGSFARDPDGLSADIAGPSFNAGPFMKDSTPPPSERPPLTLHVDVDRLYFATDRWLSQVHFRGRRGPERWETADLAAQTSDGPGPNNQAILTLQRMPDGRQTLDMLAEDAGAFLKAVDVSPNIIGGRIVISGATDESRPRHPVVGHFHMTEYRIVRAPVLARLLSVALLTGVLDSLTGEGIRFAQLDADFAYYGSQIEVTNARSAGPALGVTAKGTVDIDADTIDLSGTIVPANALNSLPGKIPLIGNLLTGGGGGLFAATYKLTGSTSDPKTSVNPLSTLAPGFLRNLFGGMAGTSSTDATPESEKKIEREQPKVTPP